MKYPVELVERVRVEFPNEPHLHQMAIDGSKDLPTMIKPLLVSMTMGEVLEYLENDKTDELKARCEAYMRRLALYYEVCRFAFGALSTF